ncbi:ATP-binding protein [Aminicella lysinilytica]|uniref:ATP-binding protein n=1 Tax=Aminicella lysinilytica TaxID=433323 RepID=UPI0026EADD3E|nr:ATP-binding protein [Aminicella lysinilytica]
MSHDIRTPLNAVLGFTSLALNEPDIPPNVAEYLNKIDSSGNYLIELINDVLDMAKIESGKMQINEENTDALALLNTLADTFTIQAAEKGVTLKTDFSKATTRWIMLDPLRTKQIFANLLSNAIKFSESGTQIDLIVTNEPKDADSIHTTITVKDQGCGMSQEFMDKMFMPFEQNAPSDAGTGTGLGLSIVHSLVEMMHGEIHVKSAPGKGSTFILEFDRELGKPPVNTQSDNNNSTVLKGIHILLCEDNDINALITEKLLEMIDCTIDRAENGQVGLEMFSKASSDMYDAIIMDINMPVMNGITAAKAIRALDHPNARSIPIIAMSANAFDDDIKKSLDAGMNAHISKPIDKQVLYDTLSKLIDSKN